MTGTRGSRGRPTTTPPTFTGAGPRTSTGSSSAAAVLATASDEFRLGRIAVVLVVTLLVYWAAETYVHWIAMRALVQRDLTAGERRRIVRDGWPLVAASGVPLLFLGLEALVGMETSVALDLTLAVRRGAALHHRLADGRRGAPGGIAAACSRPWSRACSGSP